MTREDIREYEMCQKCLHWGHRLAQAYPSMETFDYEYCGMRHDLYPRTCGDFTERRPGKEKP